MCLHPQRPATPAHFIPSKGHDPAESGPEFPKEPVDGPRKVVNAHGDSAGSVRYIQPSPRRTLEENHSACQQSHPSTSSSQTLPSQACRRGHGRPCSQLLGSTAGLGPTFEKPVHTPNLARHGLLAPTSTPACLHHPSLAEPWYYPSTHLH